MKFIAAALLALPALASARRSRGMAKKDMEIPLEGKSIKADSKMGNMIMAGAEKVDGSTRKLDAVDDFLWVADYEIKFQGCHHVQQFNEEADGEDEPKIQTKRLVRFRLCPSGSCSASNAGGCDSGYGDYIIDLNLFLASYWEDVQEQQEWDCEYAETNICYNNDDDAGMNQCMYDNNYSFCVEEEDDGNEHVEVEDYMECAQWELPDNDNRKLSTAMKRQLEEDAVEYYIGPYCSDQGGSVFLGVFNDAFCTNFADDADGAYDHKSFFYQMTGEALPYGESSLVGNECLSCKERAEVVDEQDNDGDDDNNDEEDEDNIIQLCEELYAQAGKCESNLSPSDNAYYFSPNENGCNYMDGIQIMRTDGTVVVKNANSNKTASIFIGLFAAAFVGLGAYVYFLKTKLDRAKIDLSGQ